MQEDILMIFASTLLKKMMAAWVHEVLHYSSSQDVVQIWFPLGAKHPHAFWASKAAREAQIYGCLEGQGPIRSKQESCISVARKTRTIIMYSDAGREQPQDVDVCVSTSCVQESKFCFSQACPEFSTSWGLASEM